MDKPEFVYVTYIATTPEKLWKALLDGEMLETGRPLPAFEWYSPSFKW